MRIKSAIYEVNNSREIVELQLQQEGFRVVDLGDAEREYFEILDLKEGKLCGTYSSKTSLTERTTRQLEVFKGTRLEQFVLSRLENKT